MHFSHMNIDNEYQVTRTWNNVNIIACPSHFRTCLLRQQLFLWISILKFAIQHAHGFLINNLIKEACSQIVFLGSAGYPVSI